MQRDHDFRDYRGRRVTVMGLGTFGGGAGAVRFLVDRGAIVTVTDLRNRQQLAESLVELEPNPPHQLHLGCHEQADFSEAELIVVNPAIRRNHPLLQLASSRGIPLTSELNLFWQHQRGRIVAVTGSNGKSTTAALLHSMLKHTGRRAWLGGNIGRSLLPVVDEIEPNDLVVLEVSSFQLTDLDRLQASPEVAIVTNFSPNHLDWHPDLNHYRWAKQTLLRWQTSTGATVLNADDIDVSNWSTSGRRWLFGLKDHQSEGTFFDNDAAVLRMGDEFQPFPLQEWLRLPGEHNLANALAATMGAIVAGASLDDVRRGLETYEPLPHRLQFVGDVAGRMFYNDSLATTPESTIVGLRAFSQPVILLAGGYDKHVNLADMACEIAQRARAVSLMGQTAAQLHRFLKAQAACAVIVSDPQADFRSAFQWAWDRSAPGDVILLSPGCASYDWFRNFSDRGDQFTGLVRQIADISRQ